MQTERPRPPLASPVTPPLSQSNPSHPIGADGARLHRLTGLAVAFVVAAGLGAPFVGASYLIDAVLVIVSFSLARGILSTSDEDGWLGLYLTRGLVGITVPVVVMAVLVASYILIAPAGFITFETTTITAAGVRALAGALIHISNLVVWRPDVTFIEFDHLWFVSLLAQAVVIAPMAATIGRAKLDRARRARLLLGAAAVVMIVRLVLVTTGLLSPATASIVLRFDPILVGLGLGVLPLATFHRHPVTRLAHPALALILVLVFGPVATGIGRAADRLGLTMTSAELAEVAQVTILTPLMIGLTVFIVWAEAVDRLPSTFRILVDDASLRWFADRSLTIYLWHLPFRFLIDESPTDGWPGGSVFVTTTVLTLAAATISCRWIERPVMAAVTGQGSISTRPVRAQPDPTESRPRANEPMQKIRRRSPNVAGLRPGRLGVPPPQHRSSKQ